MPECSICYEDMNRSTKNVTLSCFHTFHEFCIRSWFKTCAPGCCTCAVCRKRVKASEANNYEHLGWKRVSPTKWVRGDEFWDKKEEPTMPVPISLTIQVNMAINKMKAVWRGYKVRKTYRPFMRLTSS